MPELPEVETVCRGLRQSVIGKEITDVDLRQTHLRVPVTDRFAEHIRGTQIIAVERRAKYMLIRLECGKTILGHLGMSGKMLYKEAKPNCYDKHDHIIFTFGDGAVLIFHDPRRFGLMLVLDDDAVSHHKLLASLGPEPLEDHFDDHYVFTATRNSKAPIKSWLMNNHHVVGVGNIYASEALFRANVKPMRASGTLTKGEARLLTQSVKDVLHEAIKSGGSTLRDYVRSSGDVGYFQHQFLVYGKEDEPCTVCGTPISKIKQAGRSSFYCGTCQR